MACTPDVRQPTSDDDWEFIHHVKRSQRPPPPPAETGRPEAGAEFARRMRDHFVLLGPGQRKKGEKGAPESQKLRKSMDLNDKEIVRQTGSDRNERPLPSLPDDVERTIPVTYPHDEGLLCEAKGRYIEDPFFQKILDSPKAYKNFAVSDDRFIRLKLYNRIVVCVPNIRINGRRLQEMVIDQAHSMLAHLGAHKTLSYLREFVWWSFMARDVDDFCSSCKTCQRSKPMTQKPYGLLNPLSVPTNTWEAIGVDFVGPLPSSKDRNGEYNSITVIIDLLTAMVHLVPSRDDYTARKVAELMFVEVYRHHGLPRSIISDQDVLFTSAFWTHLNHLIGVKLKMSSTYHPETDGSTERANRTIRQMLRSCIGPTQHDWVLKLPAIEFAINSAHSESTGYAPFFLNTGRMPRSMIWTTPENDGYPSVRVYAQKMKNALVAAHDALLTARVKQTEQANKKRRLCPFVKGDLVYISTKNIRLERGTSRKLFPKFIGPVTAAPSDQFPSDKLALSDHGRRHSQ